MEYNPAVAGTEDDGCDESRLRQPRLPIHKVIQHYEYIITHSTNYSHVT